MKGDVPPVARTVALPVKAPLHATLVCAEMEAVGPSMLLTVAEAVAVHPLASVIVTLYVLAGTLTRSWVVAPLLHA